MYLALGPALLRTRILVASYSYIHVAALYPDSQILLEVVWLDGLIPCTSSHRITPNWILIGQVCKFPSFPVVAARSLPIRFADLRHGPMKNTCRHGPSCPVFLQAPNHKQFLQYPPLSPRYPQPIMIEYRPYSQMIGSPGRQYSSNEWLTMVRKKGKSTSQLIEQEPSFPLSPAQHVSSQYLW